MSRYCEKCGAELDENCKGKYCKECKKEAKAKAKKIVRAVKAVVFTGVVVGGGIYVWNSQPEFVKNMVRKTASKEMKKARKDLEAKASDLENKGRVLIKKSEVIKEAAKKIGRTPVRKF